VLRRSIAYEVGLALVVLGVASVLVATEPVAG
jgi:putative copper export protein